MNYCPKGQLMLRVFAIARENGTVTTRDAADLTGRTLCYAGSTLTRMRRDGWLERIEPGVYRLSAKGENWGGPIADQVAALCNDGAVTAQFVAWRLKTTIKRARFWLKWLAKEGRVERRGYGVYGRVTVESKKEL